MESFVNRTASIKKNIIASLFLKCINILTGLLLVPLTIDYVNSSKYGVWLTVSSIVLWLSYFDLGLIHGFRNKYTTAISQGKAQLAQEYLSTTYAILAIIFGLIFICILPLIHFFNWSALLNLKDFDEYELKQTFSLLIFFFCIDMVAKVFTTMLIAEQKPALATFIQTIGQVAALLGIYILTLFSRDESLTYLASILTGVPCLLLIIISFVGFTSRWHNNIRPSKKNIRFSLVKDILGLGGKFFVITVSMLFIYNLVNIILTRILGPESVTEYNIAYKMFGVIYMIVHIILTPFWSAFTDAYVKKDLLWMNRMMNKLEMLWFLCIPILFLMLCFSDYIYEIWLGKDIQIPLELSIAMSIYTLFEILGAIYMYLINGIGKVTLQLYIYACVAIVAIPLISFCCQTFGVSGAIIIPTLVYLIQGCVGRIQLRKLLNGQATGIWNK